MSKLEELRPQGVVRGILPHDTVAIVSVQWHGSDVVEVIYKDSAGKPNATLLYRDDEPRLELLQSGRPWSLDGDGALFRVVSEAHRIRLAYLFDPLLAVHTSLLEPLPHQITAIDLAPMRRMIKVRLVKFDGTPLLADGLAHESPTDSSLLEFLRAWLEIFGASVTETVHWVTVRSY